MRNLVLLLGDQLSPSISALAGFDPAHDAVVMAEVMSEASYATHHRQKLVLIFAAMRHFAAALRQRGYPVFYQQLDDGDAAPDLAAVVRRVIERVRPERLVITACGEYRLAAEIAQWPTRLGLTVEVRDDDRFACSTAEFIDWISPRRQPRMEHFYRWMRQRHRLLMAGDQPEGGQWNFDGDNRQPYRGEVAIPRHPPEPVDEITRQVMAMVASRFPERFGALADFRWAVTAAQAQQQFDHFVAEVLPHFGRYQDAMVSAEPFLFHSLVSTSLNIGLLLPLDLCRQVEAAWRRGRVPLNAAEGFIRQIIGWREYVRGLYWWRMPDYGRCNQLAAHRPLPPSYWGAPTRMRCIGETVQAIRDHGYAHHIQRLMVTGNFALLAGLDPDEVCDWYLAVFADAFDWVELPNTRGMALHADGGLLGSKPYAASGAYIKRMSNYCQGCWYDVRQTTGARACPFNALYWDFIDRHLPRWQANPRMALIVRQWQQRPEEERQAIREQAQRLLNRLEAL